jgi:hypothetical protein
MLDLDTIEKFLRTTAIHGLGYFALAVFVGISLFAFYRVVMYVIDIFGGVREWVPKMAGSHTALMDTLRENSDIQTQANQKTAVAVETLSRTRSEDDARTHRAMRHLTVAAQKATSDQEVKRHLDEALRELHGT